MILHNNLKAPLSPEAVQFYDMIEPQVAVYEHSDDVLHVALLMSDHPDALANVRRPVLAHRTWTGAWNVIDARASALLASVDNYLDP